jgi:hypothetical protein
LRDQALGSERRQAIEVSLDDLTDGVVFTHGSPPCAFWSRLARWSR